MLTVAVCWGVLVCAAAASFAQPSAFHPEAETPPKPAAPAAPEAAPPAPAPEAAAPEALLAAMSLQRRVAQLMMISIQGTKSPLPEEQLFLKTLGPGAALVRRANKPGTVVALTTQIRMLSGAGSVPPWIGTDLHELAAGDPGGGASPFPALPSLLTLAAANDDDTTRQIGVLLATHLQALGFDLWMGPPLSLAPGPGLGGGSVNCLGGDPAFVARAAGILMDCHRARGVVCLPMGFPGGALNREDRGAAVLTTAPAQMDEQDLLPFRKAAEADAPMIHVGNTYAPLIDTAGRPASLSPAIITGLLRGQLGYKGVVVAGPMDAPEISSGKDPAEAALDALRAGADMLLWQGPCGQPGRTVERIVQAVTQGELPAEVVDAAVLRVLRAKQSRPVPAEKAENAENLFRKNDLGRAVEQAERRAITLLHQTAPVLPLDRDLSTPVGVTGTVGTEELWEALRKPLKHVSMQPITTARHIGDIQRFEIERLTKGMGGFRTIICVLSDRERVETQIELVRALKTKAQSLVVVYLGWPGNAHRLGDADAILLAYGTGDRPGHAMNAVADVLLGKGPVGFADLPETIALKAGEARTFSVADVAQVPSGRLPVALSEKLPAGHAARFAPANAVKKAEWTFGDKRVAKPAAPFTFEAPGTYPVTVTLTDQQGESRTRTFQAVVE
ncbi:MAG: PKD domain-containing protein [Candidatus Hydrogenedentes bacterium]|nr:PKD domain-containing protein [Candidatus Hydrogenedentota bacterium]